jgi:protein tyrosine phosphatase type 4A
VNKPTLIEYKGLKFLIMDSPKDSNLHLYLKECKRHNVKFIARISPPSYSVEEVNAAGISLQVLNCVGRFPL